MAATIKIKNSSTTGAVPTSGDLVQGELAVNVTDTGLYTENASGTVVKLNAPSIDDKNTGATKHLTISTAGNLGLGVTPSAWGTANSVKALQTPAGVLWNYTSGNLYLGQNYYFNGSNRIYLNNTAASEYQQNAGAHYWYTAPSGTAGNAITFTQAMTLDASGNLLVGTTTATEKVTVAGNISINTSGNPYLQIKTSGAGNNPYIRLQADTATWDIQGTFSNAGDELYLIYGGSNRGYFNSSTGAYTAVSDQRLKKEVTDITYGLSAVMALHPVEYLMNNEANDAQKHLGFIAQEAQSAVPSSVSEMTDGILGMDKTEIIAVLVKAIQEQQAIIETLTSRIAALENK